MHAAILRAISLTHAGAAYGANLLAQSGDAAAAGGSEAAAESGVNPLVQFFVNPLNLILLSAILFMFIVVRPQQKQMKDLQKALAGLKKNDRVVLNSGIHGTIVQANPGEDVVSIRIDENSGTRVTVNREAISKIQTENKE